MKSFTTNLTLFSFLLVLSSCGTTQKKDVALTETPAIPYCTKLPLMADLSKSYINRVYIEDGMPCTKKRKKKIVSGQKMLSSLAFSRLKLPSGTVIAFFENN